ncbi:hypothetical protein PUMCH_004679 [Australozyma saopauloensis]|uniref:F-box domain-containing protein n=1 Tax=Australozyma saopauloensis TaxID=291208 RepID=A0AAX4HFX6_9ASCO|nr:hypothetical protein PUMCH_004679 [[Candida] saopauloensis]
MSHGPPQYPLLQISPTYDLKMHEPSGKVVDTFLTDPFPAFSLSHAAAPKESRKRYRPTATASNSPGPDPASEASETGDEMIISDMESGPITSLATTTVHRLKRRLTLAGLGVMASLGVLGVLTNLAVLDESAFLLLIASSRYEPALAVLTASTSCPPLALAPFPLPSAAVSMAVVTPAERDPIHPCTPAAMESMTGTPVSDMDDQNPQQLVLPLPLASPVQAAKNKASAHEWMDHYLRRAPATQSELVELISKLSGLVLPVNKSNLAFQVMRQLERLQLLSLCGLVQRSLQHDLLTSLPLEISLNILSRLDAESVLKVSQVCRLWFRLVDNNKLWCNLLRRDKLVSDELHLQRELSDPLRLIAEWSTSPSARLPEANIAQLLYKKRHIIMNRWMDDQYEPRRISISGHGANIVTCLQHDEEKVITGIEGKVIHVHSTKTGKLLRLLKGHDGGVWALKYFSNTLVSGSTDRDVRIWNIRTGRCTHIFRGHTSTVRCLDILHPVQIGVDQNGEPIIFPEVPLLVTGSRDHNLHVWKLPMLNEQEDASGPSNEYAEPECYDSKDPNNPYLVTVLVGHTQSVRSVTAYGNIVISGSYDTTVRVWDLLDGGRCKHVLEGHNDKIYSTALNFKNRRCYSGSMDLSINVWDFDKGKLLYSLEGHNSLVGLLELSENYLVSAAADSTLRVWDSKTGENLSKLRRHNSAITCFQHDDHRIVSGSERMLKLWNIRTGHFVRDFLSDITGSIWQVSFDQDRCVAAVQNSKDGREETYIEILDFSTPLYRTHSSGNRVPVLLAPAME